LPAQLWLAGWSSASATAETSEYIEGLTCPLEEANHIILYFASYLNCEKVIFKVGGYSVAPVGTDVIYH